jgi:hypothetical protein
MRATPVSNPANPKPMPPAPQNASKEENRPTPDPAKGIPQRGGRPTPPGSLDYDDGAWM